MYTLLVRLMLISALAQFGMTLWDFQNCNSRQCVQGFERRSRDILKIDWKPISVFPEEANKFQRPK